MLRLRIAVLIACSTLLPITDTLAQTLTRVPKSAAGARGRTLDAVPDAGTPDREGLDWPQFLGPEGTGISNETGLLEKWPAKGPAVVWKVPVGTGYSAPSVLSNRLVVHHRPRNQEVISCYRADNGEPLWKHSYESNFRDPFGYNNGPRCTPLLSGDRCYTFGAEGRLLCLNLLTGEKIWERNTQDDWTVPQGFFGVGATPILEGDLLIVLVGGQPNSGVVAFDASTGKTVWENIGKDTWDGVETGWPSPEKYRWTGEEAVVSYSSPIAATIHGKRHILCFMRHGLVSVDPKTGKLNFKYWFRSRSYESVNAARPVVIGDHILLSSAYRTGAGLIKVRADGKSYDEVWRDSKNLMTHWSTAIIRGEYAYGFSGRHERQGELRCLNWKTGDIRWASNGTDPVRDSIRLDPVTGQFTDRKTGDDVPWPFYSRGSATAADGKFVVLGERGTLALVQIDDEKLVEISRTSYPEIRYPAWTAPVISRKRVYLRSEDHLLCLDVKP